MMADFLFGFLAGGLAAIIFAIVLVLLAFTGWMDSGSH